MENIYQEAVEVKDTIEDAVEYICREYQLSGEKVWTMVYGLSEAHLNQFPIEDEDYEE
tara:strand:- start:663 stop:836 length:174 start_codon:yes stop_codon:yes gene_type:complete